MVITVALTKRQEKQLLAVADEIGRPMHEVGEAAIVAFLATHGHGTRGRLKPAARKRKRAAK